MTLTPVIRETFRNPREAAAMLLSMGVPRGATAMAFVLAIVLSILVTEPFFAMMPPETFGPPISPMARAAMTGVLSAALVWVIWMVARRLGSRARLEEVFLIFAYLEAMLSAGLGVMLLTIFVTPFLAGFLGLAVTFYWAYLLAMFFAEALDVGPPIKAFGIVLMAWVIVYVAGILLLTLIAPGGTP